MEVLLEALDRAASEVVVVLVGDERIRELNRQWRGKDQPTDVLSFSLLEGESMAGGSDLLGDIVVSVETLRRQAREGNWSDQEELARLLLHGLLHLLGYDHEREADESVMKAQESRLARALLARGLGCAWEEDRQ
ncbi:MAG: rRNA maturation RNase YbeY [Deltaproteobacteria bacterium]|nr:rRNA maturation RNase YbeY [Deltaproteobacteria bacterium]